MIINKELAQRMESCIKQTHIEVTKQYSQGKIFEIGGGAACFSDSDSFLSQVVGWGFSTKAKHLKTEIEKIEHFYQALDHDRVDIELCPFVGSSLALFLGERGYGVTELNNVSLYNLKDHVLSPVEESPFKIRQIKPEDYDEWAKRVAMGFGYPEAAGQFLHYIKAKGTCAFAAFDQGDIIAGATVAIHGDICDLGVTSTLHGYRGKGLQKKLLMARLNCVKQQGLAFATVTTEPGTISDLNVQKIGFQCAYTRIKMSLDRNK